MMKLMTVAMLALAMAMPVFAADGADKSIRVRGLAKEVKLDEGKTDQGSLVVTVKEDAQTFVVNVDTSIKAGEKKLVLKDVKVGDKVRVDYTEADGKKVASKIRIETNEK